MPGHNHVAMKPLARNALLYASFGHAMCHGSQLAARVVMVTAAIDLGVSLETMGWALSAFTLCMGLAALPAGLLADRYGTARVTNLYFWLLALGAGLCSLDLGFGGFVVSHALLGAAAGFYHPAGLGLLSVSTSREELGRVFGWHGVAGNIGVASVPLIVTVLAVPFGWRGGFVGLAATAVGLALVGHVLRSTGRLYDGVPERKQGDPRPLGSGALLLLFVIAGNAFLLEGFTTVFPRTVEGMGTWVLDDATVMAGILALGGVGQYMGGLVARGTGVPGRYAAIVFAQPLILAAAASFLDHEVMPFVLLGAFAFANYMSQPIENHMLAAITARARRGMAYALKFLAAMVLASPAPLIAARIYERHGDGPVFAFLAVVGVCAASGALVLRRRSQRAASGA